ncbi:OmpH family outer membrane protein [bacterium AH-315-B15]|nr:OmpH family outer membrane protein [bacterium AH-315-B15]
MKNENFIMGENKNSLAKISLGANAVLLICVIILFVKMPGGTSSVDSDGNDSLPNFVSASADGQLKIGFFNTDSLNRNLTFVTDLEKEIEAANTKAENKMLGKQKEIDAWNKKWEAKGTLLSKEQEQYMKEAQQMQNDAMRFEQQVQMELAQEQERLMMGHVVRVSNFTKMLAEKEGYDMILSYQLGQNLVYVNPTMECTNALAKMLNDDYNGTINGANFDGDGAAGD